MNSKEATPYNTYKRTIDQDGQTFEQLVTCIPAHESVKVSWASFDHGPINRKE